MNMGVSTSPCGVVSRPTRATPSLCSNSNRIGIGYPIAEFGSEDTVSRVQRSMLSLVFGIPLIGTPCIFRGKGHASHHAGVAMFRSLAPVALVVALAAPAAAQESVYKKGLKSTVWVVQATDRKTMPDGKVALGLR